MDNNGDNEVNEIDELNNAVRIALQRKGVLSNIKSKLRAEIFNCIEDKIVPKPSPTHEIQLSSDLIKEFMKNFKYENSLAVFNEETDDDSNQNSKTNQYDERQNIAKELGIRIDEKDKNIPLLILIVNHLLNIKNSSSNN